MKNTVTLDLSKLQDLDDRALISTAMSERTNPGLRLLNRRYTRLTMDFSKTSGNHQHSVALFIFHFNFCRIHSAHKQTPAMAAKN